MNPAILPSGHLLSPVSMGNMQKGVIICRQFGQPQFNFSITRHPRSDAVTWGSSSLPKSINFRKIFEFKSKVLNKLNCYAFPYAVSPKRSRFRDLVPIGTNVQIWSRKRPDLPLKSRSCLIGHKRAVYRSQTVKIPSGM